MDRFGCYCESCRLEFGLRKRSEMRICVCDGCGVDRFCHVASASEFMFVENEIGIVGVLGCQNREQLVTV